MRWLVVEKFKDLLLANQHKIEHIAIVGGSAQDPEAVVLNENFPNSVIHYLGIDNYGHEKNWFEFDLNEPSTLIQKFDLVVCSQVLEHIWEMQQAFQNLSNLAQPDGLIWLNCPTSNIAHGSPDYYSAGYTPEYLEKNMSKNAITTIESGVIGSKRYYRSTHIFRLWATMAEHNHPLLGYRIPKPITKGKIMELCKRVPGRIVMMAWDRKITSNIDYATETYYFGKCNSNE
jgi:SAM-dependent methyltransferase